MTAIEAAPTTVTYREAVKQALRDALESDERVFLMGEDIGAYGGCFAVTTGLLDEFGPVRVRDTPLSESTFVGAGIGAAMGGMRPIVEIMTCNFSLLALDQIVNNAATLLHMSGGQFNVPLVIRTTAGAGRQLAAQHSHSFEPVFAHIPGIRVLSVATHDDARGLLAPALADPDPVVLFEYPTLYNLKAELGATAAVDLDSAAIRRDGRDLTVVTYGATLHKVLDAATTLAADGIEAEVIDLRSLRPLDMPTVFASVARTHRLLVVEEAWRTAGLGAEIAAQVAEESFWDLDAPVARIGSIEVPMPYASHLEEAALPQPDRIAAAARSVVGAHG
jgi:pyruvate dehydrogenase E1 component beta subunit